MPEEFYDLRKTWDQLLRSSPDRAITQTWEWFYTWWEAYKDERDLHLIVGYDNNQIIGIAPLSRPEKPTKYYGFLRYKTFWFLASGRTNQKNVISDYLNFIILDGRQKDFLYALLNWMNKSPHCDEIILENISSESVVPKLLEEAANACKLNYQIMSQVPTFLIKLPDTWEDYLHSVSASLRYKIRRGRKEVSKLGGTYRLVRNESQLLKAFDDLERLHQHRWHSKGQFGSFSSPKWKAFHKKLALLLFRKGCLRLSFLDLDGRPVAANYNFVYDNKVHFFQSGIIPHENKHVRPGLLLHSYCIEEAIREGFVEYDFLKIGNRGPTYKEMWANYTRDLVDIRISKHSNKERIYMLFSQIFSFLRNIKGRIESKRMEVK
ncbi:MAG: GNAT family N-acetyltransferase [Desulfobacteraceae bacterium]|nr:GNAT family N-acetyltransferase [Pseudomonadota bacterium]MCG2829907.1 GNAT family N-acetyltransferase [Desulfobacteraceae bacterium]